MRVLAVGGSGYLGKLVLPMLAQQHTLRILDLRAPADPNWEYIAGSVADFDALARAVEGVDVLLYMAMGEKEFASISSVTSNFDVSVKGVYLALYAASQAGISHAVYTSSMSVYAGNLIDRFFPDEELTPDATHFYGLSKRFGEEVCRNATRTWGMSANALRLCYPMPNDEWLDTTRAGTPTLATAASDVAQALLAALTYRAGFQAFMISGDYEQKVLNMAKARRLLGWEPQARPRE
jgi:nucleoside-diphosphate-sugar epimerase